MADDPSAESDKWMLTASTRIAPVLDHGREVAAFPCFTLRVSNGTPTLRAPITAIQTIYSLTSVRFLVTFEKKEKRR